MKGLDAGVPISGQDFRKLTTKTPTMMKIKTQIAVFMVFMV